MKRIFTLFLAVLLVSTLSAQKPEGVIMKASVAPELDGKIDEVWAEANEYNIDKNFQQELPTLGESGETTWKALWTDDGFYLLLQVTDDEYYPSWITGGANSWQYDKPEIYFDVNYVLEDGLGCQGNVNKGHYQFDVGMTEATVAGERFEVNEEKNGLPYVYSSAFLVDDPNYTAEYFFPFLTFTSDEGGPIDLTGEVGFDVTIIDNDSPGGDDDRQRAVWANMGAINESWGNMDDAGIITFDGAEPPIYVDEINLTVDGAITEDNQTLQVMAEVLPEDASTKVVSWSLTAADGGIARASISIEGVVTPVIDEEVIIMATSLDGFILSNEVSLSISGQKVTMDEVNYIKNGNFDVVKEDGAPGDPWTGGSTVVDGVLNITNTNGQGTDPWSWTVGQTFRVPEYRKDEAFVLKLKMWITESDTVDIDLELAGDPYTRFGSTSDPKSADGLSQWMWPALSTEPTTYELALENLSGMQTGEGALAHKFNIFAGRTNATVYVDSIYLVAVADMDLIETAISQEQSVEQFRVYPNPASSKLNVELSSANLTVAIYNSVGVKMDEVVVFGTRHTFDVSRYAQGLYFVKAGGAVVKFIK